MVSVWRCDGDGGGGSGCMAPTREPRLHPESPLFPTLLSLFFFPLATTRGIPGWDLQDPANMRPIKATRPRLNLSFVLSFAPPPFSLSLSPSPLYLPPLSFFLSLAIIRSSRDNRILPAADLPVLPSQWDSRSIHRTTSWKMPRRFFDRLIRRISDVIKTLIASCDPRQFS